MKVVGDNSHPSLRWVDPRLIQQGLGEGEVLRRVGCLILQNQPPRLHAMGREVVVHARRLADLLAIAGAAGEHHRDLRVGLQIVQGRVQPGPQGQRRLRAVDPRSQDDDRVCRQGRHVAAPPVNDKDLQPQQRSQSHRKAAIKAPADQPPAVISGGQAIQQPGKHQERRQPQQQKAGKPDAQAPDEHQKQAENGAARRPDQPGLSSSAAPVDIVPVQGPLFSPLPLH